MPDDHSEVQQPGSIQYTEAARSLAARLPVDVTWALLGRLEHALCAVRPGQRATLSFRTETWEVRCEYVGAAGGLRVEHLEASPRGRRRWLH